MIVTPTDRRSSKKPVSPTDTIVVQRSDNAPLTAQANPEGSQIPFELTHTVTVNGETVTTVFPADVADTGIIQYVCNIPTYTGSNTDPTDNQTEGECHLETLTGTLTYGQSVRVGANKSRADPANDVVSFTVHFTDGSTTAWNMAYRNNNSTNQFYDFKWDSIASAVEGKTVEKYSINLIYNIGSNRSTTLVRPISTSRLKLVSGYDDSHYIYNYFTTTGDSNYAYKNYWVGASMSVGFTDNSTTMLTTYYKSTREFRVVEDNSNLQISSLRITNTNDSNLNSYFNITKESDRCYLIQPKGTWGNSIIIDVQETPIPSQQLDIVATSADYSLNSLIFYDSTDASKAYSDDARGMRYTDAACTSASTNGASAARNIASGEGIDHQTVSSTFYCPDNGFDRYLSIVAMSAGYNISSGSSDTNLGTASTVSDRDSYYRIENIHFYNETDDTEVFPDFRTGRKGNAPYIQFQPQSFHMKVTFDVKEIYAGYKLFVRDIRPTTFDTFWTAHFTFTKPRFISGTETSTAKAETGGSYYVYNKDNEMFSDNKGKTVVTTCFGIVPTDSANTYTLKYSGDNFGESTVVKSVKVYEADDKGNPLGSPLTGYGITYDGKTEADYQDFLGLTSNPDIFNKKPFTMPEHNLVIVLEYARTVAPCTITQSIVDGEGNSTAAGDGFNLTFNGIPRGDALDTPAFYEGNTVELTGASNVIGFYRSSNTLTQDMTVTTEAPDGYVLYKVRYYSTRFSTTTDQGGKIKINGNTVTVPRSLTTNYTAYGGLGVGFNMEFLYCNPATVNVHQSTDGEVTTTTKKIGTVKLTSQNNGSFIDNTTRKIDSSYTHTLYSADDTGAVLSSPGNRLHVAVTVNDNQRVLKGITAYRVKSDSTREDLTVENLTTTFTSGSCDIAETLDEGDQVYIDVEYYNAARLKVQIVEKDPENNDKMIDNTTSAVVTVIGSNAVTDKQFTNFSNSAEKVDQFTVTGTNTAQYTTVGNTHLDIAVTNVPDGYVIANVDVAQMTSDGKLGTSLKTILTATTQNVTGYGVCRDVTTSSLNMSGNNLWIRVILAKTAEVTVNYMARGGGDTDVFSTQDLADAHDAEVDLAYSNSKYGENVYPVIMTDQASSNFSAMGYTVTRNPATRTKDGSTVAVPFTTSNYRYEGDLFKAKFELTENVMNGWHYDINVNIEKAASVRLSVWHNHEDGQFYRHDIQGNASAATLTGSRGTDDPADAPYHQAAYQSVQPFAQQAGTANSMASAITANRSHNSIEYYVLRHTDLRLAVKPDTGDTVKSVVAYNADTNGADTYECRLDSTDADGTQYYTILQRTGMTGEIAVDVRFADTKTYGSIKIVNQDIFGNPLNVTDGVGTIQLKLTNSIYATPGYDSASDTLFREKSITGASAEYDIVVGSSGTIAAYGGTSYSLCTLTVTDKDGNDVTSDVTKNNGYTYRFNFSEGSDFTVTNTFMPIASVYGEVNYIDYDGEDVSDSQQRFKNSSSYNAIYLTDTLVHEGDELHTDNYATATKSNKSVVAGNQIALRIVEPAGYRVDKLRFYGDGFDYTYRRGDITSAALPDTGNTSLTVPLPTDFPGFTQGGIYHIKLDLTAEFIHVFARECSQQEYEELLTVDKHDFDWEHKTSYHDPQKVANVGSYSIDGGNSNQYYAYNTASMGVRVGSQPHCTVVPQYNYNTKTHYRIGKIYYSDTLSNLRKKEVYINNGPLGDSMTKSFDFDEPIDGDRYVYVLYVTYKDADIPKDETHDFVNPNVAQTTLRAYFQIFDETTNSYRQMTSDEMAAIAPTLTVSQKCVGYATPSASNPGNKHAYDTSADPPNVYVHDEVPTVEQWDADEGRIRSDGDWGVPALITDGEHPSDSRTVSGSIPVNRSDPLFYIKTDTVDTVTWTLEPQHVPENTHLESVILTKHDVNNGTVSVTQTLKQSEKSDVGAVTVIYQFRRPELEMETSNYAGAYMGKVDAELFSEGESQADQTLAIRDDDNSQSTFFDAGKTIKITITPNTGYTFTKFKLGTSRGNWETVPDSEIEKDGDKRIFRLPARSANAAMYVQFDPIDPNGRCTLNVNQYALDGDGNPVPIDGGKVTIRGTNPNVGAPLIDSPTNVDKIEMTAQSLTTGVYDGTTLTFALVPPDDYALAAAPLEASYTTTDINGLVSAPTSISFTKSGSSFTFDNAVLEGQTVTVNVYYDQRYRLYYDQNCTKLDSGKAPEDDTLYTVGQEAAVAGNPDGMVRRGYEFKGWSTENGGSNASGKVGSTVTFGNEDIYLYAIWQSQTPHNLIYDGNGGTPDTQQQDASTYYAGDAAAVKDNEWFSKPNCTFLGWSMDPAASSAQYVKDDTVTFGDDDITLYAVWEEDARYSVYYDGNGGTPSERHQDSGSYYAGSVHTVLDNTWFTKEHYHFLGWSNTSGDNNTVDYTPNDASTGTVTIGNADKVLYAVWQLNQNDVEYYNINGYDGTDSNRIAVKQANYHETVHVGSGVTPPDVSGKTFDHWELVDNTQKDADGTAIADRTSFPMPDKVVRFNAVYRDTDYTVHYLFTGDVPEGLTPPTDVILHLDDTLTPADKPTVPSGYSFYGWLYNDAITSGFTVNAATPTTINLVGEWSISGISYARITYTSGVDVSTLPEGSADANSLRNRPSESCVKGQPYTFRPNEGWTDYTREGYRFTGWRVVSVDALQPTPAGQLMPRLRLAGELPEYWQEHNFWTAGSTVPALSNSLTLTAVWEQVNIPEIKRHVVYDGNGATAGNVPNDDTAYAENETVTVLPKGNLARSGFTFKQWNTQKDGKGQGYAPGETFKMGSNDVTLYAIWEAPATGSTLTSPGTGESMAIVIIAFTALLLSAGGIAGITVFRRKKDK